MASPSDTVSLRITLRYRDLDEFVKRYAENVSSAGLFLRTRAPKPAGTKIRFELLLADGTRALRGEGVVVTVRSEDKPGMALRFNVLDADSRTTVDRIVAEHGEGALAPTPLSTSFGAKPAREAPPRSGSTTGWRPMKAGRTGWVQMGTANNPPPRRGGSSVGRPGILPRRPTRGTPSEPPAPAAPSQAPTERPRRTALPRQRSEIPRPWAKADVDDRTERLDLGRLGKVADPEPTATDVGVPGAQDGPEAGAASEPRVRSLEDLQTPVPDPAEVAAEAAAEVPAAEAALSELIPAAVPASTAEAVPLPPPALDPVVEAPAPDVEPTAAAEAPAQSEAPASSDAAPEAEAPALDAWASAIPRGLGPESEEMTALDPRRVVPETEEEPAAASPTEAPPPVAEATGAVGPTPEAEATGDDAEDAPGSTEASAPEAPAPAVEATQVSATLPSTDDAEASVDPAPASEEPAPPAEDVEAPAEASAPEEPAPAVEATQFGATLPPAEDVEAPAEAPPEEPAPAVEATQVGATLPPADDVETAAEASASDASDEPAPAVEAPTPSHVETPLEASASDEPAPAVEAADAVPSTADHVETAAEETPAPAEPSGADEAAPADAILSPADDVEVPAEASASDEPSPAVEPSPAIEPSPAVEAAPAGATQSPEDDVAAPTEASAADEPAPAVEPIPEEAVAPAPEPTPGADAPAAAIAAPLDDLEATLAIDPPTGEAAAPTDSAATADESAAETGPVEDADPVAATDDEARAADDDAQDAEPPGTADADDPVEAAEPALRADAVHDDDAVEVSAPDLGVPLDASVTLSDPEPEPRDLGAAEASDFAGADEAEADASAEAPAPEAEPEATADTAEADAAPTATPASPELEAEAAQVLADVVHEAATTAMPSREPLPRALSNSWGEAFEVAAALTDQLAALDPFSDPDPSDIAAAVVDTASAIAQELPPAPDAEAPTPDTDFDAALDQALGAATADVALPVAPTIIEGPSEDVGPETQLLDSPELPGLTPEAQDPTEADEDPLAHEYGAPRLATTETPWPEVNEALYSARYRSPTQTGTATEVPAVPAARGDSVAEKMAVAAAAALSEATAYDAESDDADEAAADADAPSTVEVDAGPAEAAETTSPAQPDEDAAAPEAASAAAEPEPEPEAERDAAQDSLPGEAAEAEPALEAASAADNASDTEADDEAPAESDAGAEVEPPAEAAVQAPMDEAPTRAVEPDVEAEPEDQPEPEPEPEAVLEAPVVKPFDEAPTRAIHAESPVPEAPLDEAATRAAEPDAAEAEAPAAVPAAPLDEAPTRAAESDEAPTRAAEPVEAPAPVPGTPLDEAPTRAVEPGANEADEADDENAAAAASGGDADEADVEAADAEAPSASEADAEAPPAPKAFEDARTVPAIGEDNVPPPRDATVRVPPPGAGEIASPVPPPMGLDAATEIVRAAEAPEPDREPRPMYSTKVTVTPVTPAPSDTPPNPEVPLVRPNVDPNRQALLQRAREAAFSEEATEVPPEREQVTHHVRPRAPAKERRVEPPRGGSTDLLGRPTPTRENRVIGIDLGRHWVRIALLERGDLELIGAAGSPYLPAVVAARPDGSLVAGVKAQAILHSQPSRAVRPLEVLTAWHQGDIAGDVAEVSSWKNGAPQLRLGDRNVPFDEVLGSLLRLVREAAATHLGTDAFKACVSIPSKLDRDARQALERACADHGLKVGRFVPEPEALVQAYNLAEHPVEIALLVDVGMSHLGLAVARRTKSGFDIVGADTDSSLSATALDTRVAALTLEELRDKAGEDHTGDPNAHARLTRAVEQARPDVHRAANLELRVQLGAPGGAAGVAVERLIKLPRSRVYQAAEPVVMDICQRARDLLQRSDVDPRAVDAVVVSGSAGHFPPLVQALHALTQVEPLAVYPGPQVVVMGLARAGQALERAASASRADALHASVGIELPGGRFGPLVRAGAQLPARIERKIPTTRDNQTELELRIFQGDAEYTRSCAGLGRLVLGAIPKGLRGEVRIDMTLEIARDGVLTVTLTEPTTRASERLVAATAQTPEERRQQIQRAPAVRSRAGRPPPKERGFFGRLFGRK